MENALIDLDSLQQLAESMHGRKPIDWVSLEVSLYNLARIYAHSATHLNTRILKKAVMVVQIMIGNMRTRAGILRLFGNTLQEKIEAEKLGSMLNIFRLAVDYYMAAELQSR